MYKLSLVLLSVVIMANASVISFSNRGAFESAGMISENYGYENFGNGFSYPGNPWTAHGITYQTDDNLIVGTATWYAPTSNVFCNSYWSPIDADVEASSQYDLLAFDVGYIGDQSAITIVFTTNVNNYSFNIATPVGASSGLDFLGFKTEEGEYFTKFSLSSEGWGCAPVIDNVTLGKASPLSVPEPTILSLLSISILGIGFFRRKLN